MNSCCQRGFVVLVWIEGQMRQPSSFCHVNAASSDVYCSWNAVRVLTTSSSRGRGVVMASVLDRGVGSGVVIGSWV